MNAGWSVLERVSMVKKLVRNSKISGQRNGGKSLRVYGSRAIFGTRLGLGIL